MKNHKELSEEERKHLQKLIDFAYLLLDRSVPDPYQDDDKNEEYIENVYNRAIHFVFEVLRIEPVKVSKKHRFIYRGEGPEA